MDAPAAIPTPANVLHATLDLARRIDRAEIDFCAAAARAGERGGAASIDVGGGRGLCGTMGAPFNKVLGLGLGVPVADEDLDALEEFYDERGIPAQIELCPLTVPDLPARLSARGYKLQGFENQLARTLGMAPFTESSGVRISEAHDGDDHVWLRVVAEGFAAPEGAAMPPADRPPDPEVVARLGEVMRGFIHADYARHIAWIGDEPAGAGSSYVFDRIVGVAGTSTRPVFRRRGAQHAIVAHALNRALGHADLAMATTEPGSTSQRTFERFGFQVLYTRAIFTLP